MYVVLVLCNTRANDVIRLVNGSVDVDLNMVLRGVTVYYILRYNSQLGVHVFNITYYIL